MKQHPALKEGNVAVITGGADGIGLAAAKYYQSLGMEVCIADIDAAKLSQLGEELGDVLAVATDVAQLAGHAKLAARRGPPDIVLRCGKRDPRQLQLRIQWRQLSR